MLPFGPEELQYIRSLDFEADKELLMKELPTLRLECLRVLELSTALLKRCAEAGMTLYEIGSLVSRSFSPAAPCSADGGMAEEPSELEKLCLEARDLMTDTIMSVGELPQVGFRCHPGISISTHHHHMAHTHGTQVGSILHPYSFES
jgi:hypothetical protein